MTDLRTAAQQALEALERSETTVQYEGFGMARRDAERKHQAAIDALRAALAEPVLNPAPGYCKHCKQYTIEEPLPAEPVQEPVALDWLHKWANHDDGEPETQWHEGYEAARRVVQIHLTAPPQRPAEPVQDWNQP